MSALQTIPFPATSMVESSASQKEYAPLKQTTLLSALDKGIAKGWRKAGNAPSPSSTAVLDAMRLRIIQLEDQLATPPPTKRAKTAASASAVASTSTAGPTASSSKSEEKKRKMQVKKIFDRCVLSLA
ncbi:hypothetical protein B0H13DRAFT_2351191 [Mycena leptocephala]|nr:hypothetical protein B0H13DRAFT_2351191 [Mycena leptocephala]